MNHHHRPSSASGRHKEHDDAQNAVKPPAGAKYLRPMCEGVVSEKPGDCPKCGMALERNFAWTKMG